MTRDAPRIFTEALAPGRFHPATIAAPAASTGRIREDICTALIYQARGVQAQLAALFTRAPIRASSAAVNVCSAKAVGHMSPSSR